MCAWICKNISLDKDRCEFIGRRSKRWYLPWAPPSLCSSTLRLGYEHSLLQTSCHFTDISLQDLIWPISLVPDEQRFLYQPHVISSWPNKSRMIRTSITACCSHCGANYPLSSQCLTSWNSQDASLLWGLVHSDKLPSFWGCIWWGWAQG